MDLFNHLSVSQSECVCVFFLRLNSDTKRMEELFTKNQQMKEQQRILTENIKTLENRWIGLPLIVLLFM